MVFTSFKQILTMKKITLLILLVSLTIQAQIPTGYYDHATGATGYDLKTKLKRIINTANDPEITSNEYFHVRQDYGELWNLYPISDVRTDGKVWEMYSDCNFTFVTDQDGGSGGGIECDKFNREHSFPRSWYGDGSTHPMKSDAFHVIPSDKKVNAERGNLAYGIVATANYTSDNGSKKGSSSISTPGNTDDVFEPANIYKGDIARGLLYVAVRYEDEIASWQGNNAGGDRMLDGSSNKVFEQWAIDMLYSWHIADPVSQKEIDRNNDIYDFQSNRNPFIDHPEYVGEIWNTVLAVDDYAANDFSIYPNPTNADLVYINKGNNTIKNLELYSISGKLILSKKINTSHSTITLDNLNTIASGMYLLKIQTDKNIVIKKLVIN